MNRKELIESLDERCVIPVTEYYENYEVAVAVDDLVKDCEYYGTLYKKDLQKRILKLKRN